MERKMLEFLNRLKSANILIVCTLPAMLALFTISWEVKPIDPPASQFLPNLTSPLLTADDIWRPAGSSDISALLIPEFTGTVIDDLSEKFTREGPERYWYGVDQGYGNHFWWTYNNQTGIDNLAHWTLGITQTGTYEIFAYIPANHATSHNAVYTISHDGEQNQVIVNQDANRNSWYKLGDFSFAGTGDEYIELSDETGERDTEFEIAFDAIGYRAVDSSWEDEVTGAVWEKIRPWLDEKTASLEQAFKEWLNEQKGKFLQKMADVLKNWIDQQCAGLGAAMLLPLFALIHWRKQRYKNKKSKSK
jgi:hypothetical protein